MHAYYDTGVFLKLYVQEEHSALVQSHVTAADAAVPVSAFQELEVENALHLKLFRSEIDGQQLQAVRDKVAQHFASRCLVRRPVHWAEAFAEARRLSGTVTAKSGCRTLDVLHVAIGKLWGCTEFVTMDDRQIAAVRAAGLKVVDVRRLRPKSGRD